MNKNKEKLESLTKFLLEHPELRFWQGLLAWSNMYYEDKRKSVNGRFATESYFEGLQLDHEDTFYWE